MGGLPRCGVKEDHMINDQIFPSAINWHIADGMTVYSTDGEKVGTVRNYDPSADYLDVQKGFLFKKDFYVPLSSISAVDEDFVTLKLTKDALEDEHYSLPPALGAPPPTQPAAQSGQHRWVDSDDVRKQTLDEADTSYQGSTAEEVREDWATRPR
jgi:hypothetical protein